jgi:hypothetical protein
LRKSSKVNTIGKYSNRAEQNLPVLVLKLLDSEIYLLYLGCKPWNLGWGMRTTMFSAQNVHFEERVSLDFHL